MTYQHHKHRRENFKIVDGIKEYKESYNKNSINEPL